MAIGSFLALLTPLILRWLIDIIIPQKRISLIIVAVASLFLAYQGRTVLNSFGGYLMLIASQKMGLRLRMSLLRQLNSLSAEYYDDTPTGTAIYPLKDPVEEIAYFGSDLLPAVVKILLTTSFTLATMFALSPVLALSVVPLIPVFILTRQYYRKRLTCDSDSVQQSRRRCTDFLQEHIAGAIPIQLMGQQERQGRKGFVLMGESVRSQYRLYRTATCFAIYSSLSIAVGMCAVIGDGALRVIAGALSIGSLVAFYGFVAQLFEPLTGVAELYARVQKTFSSIRQVRLVLDLKPKISNAPNPIHIVNEAGLDLEFSFVTFGYVRQLDFLRIPSLRIFAGEKIAIVGENGAGKSTLAKLIARIYDPTSGCIRLGQADLRNIDLKDLRNNVCYLPRDPFLFEGTVASNLRFVQPTASIGDLRGALDAVALTEFVSSLPNGLGQWIGPQGCQLSGGERQRLAIARALLLRPRILILDEATSCLDPAGELTVLKNVQELLQDSTLIFISHRTSLFSRFERILSVSKGSIFEPGISPADSKFETPSTASIPQ